jgi:hypothetical protein
MNEWSNAKLCDIANLIGIVVTVLAAIELWMMSQNPPLGASR